MDSLDTYWPEILGVVRQKVQQQTFDTWFLPLQPDGRNGNGALRVFCPNPFYLDWFSEHHLSTLNEAGSAFFGRSIDFNLAVDPLRTQGVEIFRPEKPADPTGKPVKSMISPGNSNDGNPAARLDQNLVSEVDSGHPQLNIDYTFDSFVVGSGSNLAYAAATSVAKTPADHYNPLFIHGGSGLGKTHLLHAVGNEIRRNFPEKKICYVTAEQFMNDLVLRHPAEPATGLQAPLPQRRRSAGGRRGFHGGQGDRRRRSSSTPSTLSTARRSRSS